MSRNARPTLDPGRIDEAVLAILFLGLHDGDRAWKGLPWEATDRLHVRGLIENPRNRAKLVIPEKAEMSKGG